MSMMSSGSRVSRLGDSMTGELGFESNGTAAHKVGFVAGQGILKLLSGLGSVNVSAALGAAMTVNCQSTSGDGLFYRLAIGEACVFRNTGFAFEMLYAPSGAAGAVCAFTQTFQFSTGGVMTVGKVPLSRMRRIEVSSENAGTVTLLASSTLVTSIDLGTVVTGDRIFVTAVAAPTKGVTAGDTSIFIDKSSGTALVTANQNASSVYSKSVVGASAASTISLSGIMKVGTGGTLVLSLYGQSAGSNSDILGGLGEVYALVLNDG